MNTFTCSKKHTHARRAFALTLCLLLLPSAVRVAHAKERVTEGLRLALYAKPAVVRIWDGYIGEIHFDNQNGFAKTYQVARVSSGSGAFIDPNGYIVTSAHVADLTHEGEQKGRELLLEEFFYALARDFEGDPEAWLKDPEEMRFIREHHRFVSFTHVHQAVLPDGTALPFEIKLFGAPTGGGKDVAILKVEVKNAPILKLGDSAKLQLLDHVTVIGYPAAADTFDSGVLNDASALEASITDGKLSAKKKAADGAPVMQISAPATHGSSGRPVLNNKGEVMGLLAFRGDTVNGQEVSGFTFAVPASTVMEFVRQAGASNQYGAVDQRYREGLELYWQGDYSGAIEKFEEVKRHFPYHSEVDRLIRDSQEAASLGEGEIDWFWTGVLILGVALTLLILALALLSVIGFVVWRVRRSRRQPRPAAVHPQDHPHAPAWAPAAPGVRWQDPPHQTMRLGSCPAAGSI